MDKNELKRIYSSADYCGLTEKERRIFMGVVRDNSELLKPADSPIIAAYARNVNLARKAAEEIEEHGVMVVSSDKYHGDKRVENPAIGILQRAQAAYVDAALKLGLTPTGRKRLKGEGAPRYDEADEFMDS